jgi:hypothetical protein
VIRRGKNTKRRPWPPEKANLDALVEAAIVDAYGESEERTGFLELTPFRGHFIFWEGGVHDVEAKKCISAGVPATDGRVGPVGPQPGRAVTGV